MLLELKNIDKSFGEKKVLKGVSFVAESGKAFGLLGRNGAGKTTSIRILMNVFPADAGEVLTDGNPIDYDNMMIASFFNIPVDLFVYMLVFFALGFLVYAFLYAAVGSTASKLEDINTSVLPITFLFIIAFMIVVFAMAGGNVDTTLMKICSYIPFISPMAMFTRICMSTVAWYEIAISIAVLIGSTVGIGFLSAKIYRVGVLLYGRKPTIVSIFKEIRKA